jgi:hypothetical protein
MILSPRARKTALPILALLLGAAIALSLRFFADAPPALLMGVSGAVALAALWVAVLCWRALDEVAKDAHKTAWYWGGSFGMLFGFLALTAAEKFRPDLLAGYADQPFELVQLGVVGIILAQLAGYLVVWAGWWFTRR